MVTIHYLEMTSPSALRAKLASRQDVVFARVLDPWPELSRFMYTVAGGDFYWVDRLPWTRAQWRAYLARPELAVWLLSAGGLPAGYVELEAQPDGDVEIVYFGLAQRFTGQGLGAHLLTSSVRRAWDMGAKRVWLHTCSLDHPAALPNYVARGFREYRVETVQKLLPPEPYGTWPATDGTRTKDP
jgi:ribosomal protein S18 acetylase RimI-like enzyme